MACVECQQYRRDVADLKTFMTRWFNLLFNRFSIHDDKFSQQSKQLDDIQSYILKLSMLNGPLNTYESSATTNAPSIKSALASSDSANFANSEVSFIETSMDADCFSRQRDIKPSRDQLYFKTLALTAASDSNECQQQSNADEEDGDVERQSDSEFNFFTEQQQQQQLTCSKNATFIPLGCTPLVFDNQGDSSSLSVGTANGRRSRSNKKRKRPNPYFSSTSKRGHANVGRLPNRNDDNDPAMLLLQQSCSSGSLGSPSWANTSNMLLLYDDNEEAPQWMGTSVKNQFNLLYAKYGMDDYFPLELAKNMWGNRNLRFWHLSDDCRNTPTKRSLKAKDPSGVACFLDAYSRWHYRFYVDKQKQAQPNEVIPPSDDRELTAFRFKERKEMHTDLRYDYDRINQYGTDTCKKRSRVTNALYYQLLKEGRKPTDGYSTEDEVVEWEDFACKKDLDPNVPEDLSTITKAIAVGKERCPAWIESQKANFSELGKIKSRARRHVRNDPPPV